MAAYSRADDAGNTLVLKQGDRRSTAAKRIKSIETKYLAELDIAKPTEALRVLCRRAAELTFMGEELSDRLVTGKPTSVELVGRNADRLQRTMKELRELAIGVRIRELAKKNAAVIAAMDADEDDDDIPLPPVRRNGKVPTVIVDRRAR